ncbi:MAG: hypothetical protein U0V75_13995 [Ferruginibacter sp.]
MKKIFLFAMLLSSAALQAQNVLPIYDADTYGFEIQPGMLHLDADRNLCELNETVNVHIRMTVAGKDDLAPYVFAYRYRDPFDAPWTIGEFKIVSGGARVVMTEKEVAQLQMPASIPKEKAVLVQVTLNPVIKKYQQVQLFTTIYLADNDNVFYFNCAYLGIDHEKYVIKNNGGISMALADRPGGDYKNVSDAVDAKQKAAMEKLRTKQAQEAMVKQGINMTALTSNAKAVYAKETDATTIILNDRFVEQVNGIATNSKRMYLIQLSFPGNSTGEFILKQNPKVTASVVLPETGYGCACSDDPEEKKRRDEAGEKGPTCAGGKIIITRYDPKAGIVEGKVFVELESAGKSDHQIFYSKLNGHFKVPLAN